ncbi:MAG: serine/threonine-protein kinase [Nannocystaceae bacterium]
MAPPLAPCPHCNGQHEPELLRCPDTGETLPLTGRLLDGKFRLIRELGSGGMATVWLARNEHVEREVALKLLWPEVVNYDEVNERFRKEARAAGRIGSEHICEVFDFAEGPLGPYIVMEYLRGADFGQILDQYQRLDASIAVKIVRLALDGLGAAHVAGVIHRDLKPGNVFLHRGQRDVVTVKLMDFGVSKFDTPELKSVTGTGFLLGTPEYMAPEQLAGKRDIDATVDLFSTGAVLYRALSGQRLFSGADIGEVIRKAANNDSVPLDELVTDLPAGLAEVVSRCIEPERAKRYQSATELSEALRPYEADENDWLAWCETTRAFQIDASNPTREFGAVAFSGGFPKRGSTQAGGTSGAVGASGASGALAGRPRHGGRTVNPVASAVVEAGAVTEPASEGPAWVTASALVQEVERRRLSPLRVLVAIALLGIGVASVVWASRAGDSATDTQRLADTPGLAGVHHDPAIARTEGMPANGADRVNGANRSQGAEIAGSPRRTEKFATTDPGDTSVGSGTGRTSLSGAEILLGEVSPSSTGGRDEDDEDLIVLEDDDNEDEQTVLSKRAAPSSLLPESPPVKVASGRRPITDYRGAHTHCRKLARRKYRGSKTWRLASLTQARDLAETQGLVPGWYWTRNRAGARRRTIRLPDGRTRSRRQNRRSARPLCVTGSG